MGAWEIDNITLTPNPWSSLDVGLRGPIVFNVLRVLFVFSHGLIPFGSQPLMPWFERFTSMPREHYYDEGTTKKSFFLFFVTSSHDVLSVTGLLDELATEVQLQP